MGEYWRIVSRRILQEAHALLGLDKPRNHIVRIVFYGVGIGLLAIAGGWVPTAEKLSVLPLMLMAAGVVYAGALVWGIARAPYLLHNEMKAAKTALEGGRIAKEAQATSAAILQALYDEGSRYQRLGVGSNKWGPTVYDWCKRTEAALSKHASPAELWLFKTIGAIAIDTDAVHAAETLQKRLGKLRLAIGRLLGDNNETA